MPSKRIAVFGTALVAVGAAFWAGSGIQKATYLERCLDLGGGRDPGNHPICVIDSATAPLQLGPIVITAREIVGGEMRDGPNGQYLVGLVLVTGVAAALKAFTKASVGGPLDIRVDRNLVRTVNIVEGLEGDRFILPLTKADAQSLSQSLGLTVVYDCTLPATYCLIPFLRGIFRCTFATATTLDRTTRHDKVALPRMKQFSPLVVAHLRHLLPSLLFPRHRCPASSPIGSSSVGASLLLLFRSIGTSP